MTSELQQAIDKAAAHWAQHGIEGLDTADQVISYVRQRGSMIRISAPDNSFQARGWAHKCQDGLNALRAAVNERPSRQWLAVWGK